ncbi:SDR family NAD(P)-dependent oxidoreductase [Amycolatopsis echigonensis]|uniref:SDR family NAD(P)-dependent oxidoreductase n=1 Tax=Amycolatopsis echigonensis TaxID=2576905 RepID=A0A2N3WQ53_9PSEU|nr:MULTISPECIES: SDR family NAD(P)-dependent oxidoreductase [Amycolatopsis]MBB2505365.1 SDR family NAD(P)-dependent oxidoreductase [Amycolatopsis echigonensis]PKV95999.1 short-subunit dehydrogenase [Amycolatopsis niigatensis]
MARTALVTGASSGIGAATARKLARSGVRVLLHGRNEDRLAALAAETGGTALAADLARPEAAADLAERALAITGSVDLLVNNAGLGWAGPLPELSEDQLRHLVAVNLTAPLDLTRALLPAMLKRDRGQIVFVSSIAGRTGVAGEAVYAATKSGVDAFADSLRFEVHGTGVTVGIVVPGVVRTEFFERRGRPYTRGTPRPVSAERVAAAVLRAAAHPGDYYVPRWLRIPVALRGTAPGLYRALAARFGAES